MNLDHAPKFFWAALSASLLLFTGGLLLIGYRASSVSIEFADAKVQLAHDKIEVSGIVSETKDQLQTLKRQNEELTRVKAELEARIALLSSATPAATNLAIEKAALTQVTRSLSNAAEALPPQAIESSLKRLNVIQNSLNRQSAR